MWNNRTDRNGPSAVSSSDQGKGFPHDTTFDAKDEETFSPYSIKSPPCSETSAQTIAGMDEDEETVNPYLMYSHATRSKSACIERPKSRIHSVEPQTISEDDDGETVNPYTAHTPYQSAYIAESESSAVSTVNPYSTSLYQACHPSVSYTESADDLEETVNPYAACGNSRHAAPSNPMFVDDEETVNPYVLNYKSNRNSSSPLYSHVSSDDEETVNPYQSVRRQSEIGIQNSSSSPEIMKVSLRIDSGSCPICILFTLTKTGRKKGDSSNHLHSIQIGRSASCSLRFDADDVPEFLAELTCYGNTLYIFGLDSNTIPISINGTSLGMHPVSLSSGDQLTWNNTISIQIESIIN